MTGDAAIGDSARDLAALVRAHNAGDREAVEAILGNADLRVLCEMFLGAFCELAGLLAGALGVAGDDGLSAYLDGQFAGVQAAILDPGSAPGEDGGLRE